MQQNFKKGFEWTHNKYFLWISYFVHMLFLSLIMHWFQLYHLTEPSESFFVYNNYDMCSPWALIDHLVSASWQFVNADGTNVQCQIDAWQKICEPHFKMPHCCMFILKWFHLSVCQSDCSNQPAYHSRKMHVIELTFIRSCYTFPFQVVFLLHFALIDYCRMLFLVILFELLALRSAH